MTTRITARALAALAGVAIVIAACGNNGAATTAPVTQAPATTAPVTQAPAATQGAGASGDPLASFHGAQDLEGLLPDTIGGVAVTKASITGTDFVGMGASEELTSALTAMGKTPADMAVAFGSAGTSTVFVFKVNGVPGSAILNAMFAAETDPSTKTDVNIGGKSVKKVVVTGETLATYIYTTQDVVFVVAGADITDAALNDIFSALP